MVRHVIICFVKLYLLRRYEGTFIRNLFYHRYGYYIPSYVILMFLGRRYVRDSSIKWFILLQIMADVKWAALSNLTFNVWLELRLSCL